MSNQLTLDFKPTVYAGYESTREFINDYCIPQLLMAGGEYTHKKQIAADMDYSPSLFGRKLSGANDNRWSQDDTDKYIRLTGDKEPARFIAWVFLRDDETDKDKEIRELREKLKRLAA